VDERGRRPSKLATSAHNPNESGMPSLFSHEQLETVAGRSAALDSIDGLIRPSHAGLRCGYEAGWHR
jgi:hypothetical protein